MNLSGHGPRGPFNYNSMMLSLRKMYFMHKDIHLFHGNILETIYIKVVFYVVYKIAV